MEALRAGHINPLKKAGRLSYSFQDLIVLRRVGSLREAVAEYRRALALDPGFLDAHFNLARLNERAGRPKEALRHLLAYRRLMNGP